MEVRAAAQQWNHTARVSVYTHVGDTTQRGWGNLLMRRRGPGINVQTRLGGRGEVVRDKVGITPSVSEAG